MDRRHPCVYMLASKSGTIYTGVTSDIELRIRQHKDGTFEGFSARYGCVKLVWMETHADMADAIAREKQIKRWRRDKKVHLITLENPGWRDMAEDWSTS